MRRFIVLMAVSVSLGICGCSEQRQAEQKGLEIQAPGVEVKVNPEEGVHVRAGDAEVDASRERGVNVTIPGAESGSDGGSNP